MKNITFKQKDVLIKIAKSHPYFPEIALDHLIFDNQLYNNDLVVKDLMNQDIIRKQGKTLCLTKDFAKRNWTQLLTLIPSEEQYSRMGADSLIKQKPEELNRIHQILTDKDIPQGLSKEEAVNLIIETYYSFWPQHFKKGTVLMADVKKVKAEKAAKAPKAKPEVKDDGKLGIQEMIKQFGLTGAVIRKKLRASGLNKGEGTWRLTPAQAEKVLAKKEAAKKED